MSGQGKKLRGATQDCNHLTYSIGISYNIGPNIIIAIYKLSFDHGSALEAEHHIKKIEELCAQIVIPNINPYVLRIKLFTHSLV
jgi:hypothetical protein